SRRSIFAPSLSRKETISSESLSAACISAVVRCNKNVVRILLEAGADASIKDEEEGWTALDYAHDEEVEEIIEMLEKAGAR
ncbi:MAG TPA: ankyrin repeat domain-containing protein, partial [bacterium]|nr:ankyrin repeat domain-containing protein [bacterium]